MQYRQMGRTGLRVSALCLGTMTFGWTADRDETFRILDKAIDTGINFLDTADVYSYWGPGNRGGESETLLGEWLAGKDRRQIVLATKARGRMWPGPNGEGLSRVHVIQACEDSLRRLKTDYIDLYQVHSPDPATPLDETLRALDSLVQAGKVRYIGASNYPAWLLMKALWTSDRGGWARFDCLQPHYSLLHRAEYERELAAVCLDQGIGVIPYSPLAAGFLTGKYTRAAKAAGTRPETTRGGSSLITRLTVDDHAYTVVEAVQAIAQAHETTASRVALAWLLARPEMTAPIIGVRTAAQLDALLGAGLADADALSLTPDETVTLTRLSARYGPEGGEYWA
jgi:aryl-alcohol dehydrogenase-like predicted oxidoreductase